MVSIFLLTLFSFNCVAASMIITFSADKSSIVAGEKVRLKVSLPQFTDANDLVRICAFTIDYNNEAFLEPVIMNNISSQAVVNTAKVGSNGKQVYYTYASVDPINVENDFVLLELEFTAKAFANIGSSNFVFNMINFKYGSEQNQDIPYVSPSMVSVKITESDVLLGDVNGNGEITIADAMIVFQSLSGKIEPLVGKQLGAADMNKDGEVTIVDAMMLFRQIANN